MEFSAFFYRRKQPFPFQLYAKCGTVSLVGDTSLAKLRQIFEKKINGQFCAHNFDHLTSR